VVPRGAEPLGLLVDLGEKSSMRLSREYSCNCQGGMPPAHPGSRYAKTGVAGVVVELVPSRSQPSHQRPQKAKPWSQEEKNFFAAHVFTELSTPIYYQKQTTFTWLMPRSSTIRLASLERFSNFPAFEHFKSSADFLIIIQLVFAHLIRQKHHNPGRSDAWSRRLLNRFAHSGRS